MNFKGIGLFLGLNYLLLFLLVFIFLSEGMLVFQTPNLFQYLLQAALMGIPALCALAAVHLFPDDVGGHRPLWPVPAGAAIRIVVIVPLIFITIYAVATAAGLTYPQWNLAGLMNRVDDQLHTPLPPEVAAAAPWITLVLYPFLSIVVGATLFTLVALGIEIGWRGYLLPRLLPMGTLPAYIVGGICWGLWSFPLVYGWFRETDAGGSLGETMLRVVALAIVLNVVLGQIVRRTGHLTLAALCLGAFAGQANGIWIHLFQQDTPPWTGTTGWICIAAWGVVACIPGMLSRPITIESAES